MTKLSRPEKTRIAKYPNHSCFKWHNANPHHKITGDCCARALSVALGISWEDAYKSLYELILKTGESQPFEQILKAHGYVKQTQPKKLNGRKYRVYEASEMLKQYGRVFAKVGSHHVVAIVDGVVHDTWDSTEEILGNYWVKN